jgi:hypothetical protein
MMNRGLVGIGVLPFVLYGTALVAQDFGRYREFELGSDITAVSTVTGTAASDLTVIHQRPTLIQELTWRPKYAVRRPSTPDIQSVEQIVFAFHGNRLFRVTINYDQAKTAGLIDADMIEAVSAIYGTPFLPSGTQRPAAVSASAYGDPGTLIAQWGNVDDSVKLYRLSSYATRFRMVLTAEPIFAFVRRDAAQALVLDAREAPEREAAAEKKEAEDRRGAEEKARSTNRATFRP